MLEQTEADWDRVVDTNLKGAFFTAQAVAAHGSRDGRPGRQHRQHRLGARAGRGRPPGALCRRQGRALAAHPGDGARAARHGVRVNALAPGYIETEINRDFLASEAGERMRKHIPQRRFGTPADLDGALLLLASDASRYMTGSIIVVDGGLLLA